MIPKGVHGLLIDGTINEGVNIVFTDSSTIMATKIATGSFLRVY